MGKFHCPCGWSISDVAFPSSDEHHVISDFNLDALTDYFQTRPRSTQTILTSTSER